MDHERRISTLETALPMLATKSDLAQLASKADLSELRAEVADIRGDIHKAIAENAKWTHSAVIGMFTAFVIGVGGLVFTIWNSSRQQSDASEAPGPIIINIPSLQGPTLTPVPPGPRSDK
jgi:hypothetical protein